MSLQPQPLRLQREGAATGEGVVEGGQHLPIEQLLGAWVVGVLGAGALPGLPDLLACPR